MSLIPLLHKTSLLITIYCIQKANVDWALLNFMQDWFPVEAKAKLKNNEREAAEEELQELGINTQGCVVT